MPLPPLPPLTSPAALAPATLAAIAAVFLLAGAVKGIVGLGLPTIAMALLALFMPPADAATLLLAPSLATNLWQMRPFGALAPLVRRLWPLQAGACAGTVAAAALLGAPAGAWASLALGTVLVAYAAWGVVGATARVPPRVERLGAPVVGLATGVVTAATGVFVVPAVPWLQALGLKRDELIRAMGLSFTVSTLALGVALRLNGHASGGAAGLSIALLAPALAGMWAGQHVRRRLSATLFRRCFFAALVLLGVWLVVDALAH